MPGVGHEVGDDLVDLDAVGERCGQAVFKLADDLDGRGQGGAQQPEGVADIGGEVERFAVLLAVAGKGEDLADEVARAFAGPEDFPEAGGGGGGVGGFLDAEVGKADDAGEDVIEVVGDAAGAGADGFELLRLAEFVIELHASAPPAIA